MLNLLLLMILSSVVRADPAWQILGYWSLDGVHSREATILSQSTSVDFIGILSLTKNFDEEFSVAFKPSFRFVSGRQQDVFGDRLPKDKLYADEALATYRPWVPLSLSAGAINQIHLHDSLLVYRRPFPAIRAAWSFAESTRGQKNIWSLAAQLAVPSSYTLDAQATANEPLPFLQTYSLHGTQQIKPWLLSEFHLNYFRFDNLPQIVAVESAQLGNNADVFSSVTGRFRHGFEGLAPALALRANLGEWQVEWNLQGIWNWKVDTSLGVGESSQLGFTKALANQHALGFSVAYYKVLPDVAPAVYTDPIFSNNRVGLGGELHVDHERWGIRFKVSYFRDFPYYRSDLMGQRDLAFLAVESLKGEDLLAF